MRELKLGPLPKIETVRITLTLSMPLKQALDLYAADYARAYEPTEATVLIPHMLEAFLRSDRAFMRRHGKAVRSPTSPRPLPGKTSPRRQQEATPPISEIK